MTKAKLTAMTVAELKILAKKRKVSLSPRSLKADIIDALLAAGKETKPAAKRISVSAAKAPAKSVAQGKSTTGKAAADKPVKQTTKQAAKQTTKRPEKQKTQQTAKKVTGKTVTKAANTVKAETSMRPVQQKPASPVPSTSEKTPVREWKLPPGVEEPLMAQDRVSESKYYTGTGPAPQALVATYGELPRGYGDDTITLMSRDPFVAYAYWEASPARIEHEKAWFGWDAKLCVRVYDITGVQFDGRNAVGYFDQEVFERAGNWYFDFGRPAHSFCADLGLLSPGGRFLTLARSNYVTMPRDTVSESVDEEWMLLDDDFWEIYGYPEGARRGMSSLEMQDLLRRRKQMEVTSPGMFTRQGAKRK